MMCVNIPVLVILPCVQNIETGYQDLTPVFNISGLCRLLKFFNIIVKHAMLAELHLKKKIVMEEKQSIQLVLRHEEPENSRIFQGTKFCEVFLPRLTFGVGLVFKTVDQLGKIHCFCSKEYYRLKMLHRMHKKFSPVSVGTPSQDF